MSRGDRGDRVADNASAVGSGNGVSLPPQYLSSSEQLAIDSGGAVSSSSVLPPHLSSSGHRGGIVDGSSNLPPHLSRLLADPPPLLPPHEDGDRATALVLSEARGAEGIFRCTMRGLTELPLPLLRFLRVEGLNLSVLDLRGNRLVSVPSQEQVCMADGEGRGHTWCRGVCDLFRPPPVRSPPPFDCGPPSYSVPSFLP